MQKYTIIIEEGEDGYLISSVVELPGCRTQAKAHDELIARTKEAIALYKEAKKDNFERSSQFLSLQQVTV